MEYDFSGLCGDQLELVEKKLTYMNKEFIKDYMNVICIINNKNANENLDKIEIILSDLLNDTSKKSGSFYIECMKKIKSYLAVELK